MPEAIAPCDKFIQGMRAGFPCTLPESHDGPCATGDIPASVTARENWQAAVATLGSTMSPAETMREQAERLAVGEATPRGTPHLAGPAEQITVRTVDDGGPHSDDIRPIVDPLAEQRVESLQPTRRDRPEQVYARISPADPLILPVGVGPFPNHEVAATWVEATVRVPGGGGLQMIDVRGDAGAGDLDVSRVFVPVEGADYFQNLADSMNRPVSPDDAQDDKPKDRSEDQPMPTPHPEQPNAQDALIAYVEGRKALGLSRYGTLLQPFNGRDTLQDAYEEVVDAGIYLTGLWQEREVMVERTSRAFALISGPVVTGEGEISRSDLVEVLDLLADLAQWMGFDTRAWSTEEDGDPES